LHTKNTQNTKYGTYITIKKLTNLGIAGRAPPLQVIPWNLPYNRKKHGKPSVRVAARTSQVDTVQYKKNEQYNTYLLTYSMEQGPS
jgi:hypothetical protein